MKPVSITCPFTGHVVNATKDEDTKTLYMQNAITHEPIVCMYDFEKDCYCIPARILMQKYDLVSMTHAAYILGVTRQRISYIAKHEIIKPYTVNDKTMFMRSDVLDYKKNRKVGAPKKEQE